MYIQFNFNCKCVCVREDAVGMYFLLAYVHDILIASKIHTHLNLIKNQLKDMGELRRSLNINIKKVSKDEICMLQENYINQLCREFDIEMSNSLLNLIAIETLKLEEGQIRNDVQLSELSVTISR